MYSSAASGDHLSERVSDIPGDQVSNASNATISGADTRWVLICAHAHAGSCMNAQTCTCAQNCHFRESSLPCQNDRKCCATELRAHSRRTTLHILARARTHTRVLAQVDMVSVADSQTSDITECSVSDAQPSRHLPGPNGIFCPCCFCYLDTAATE